MSAPPAPQAPTEQEKLLHKLLIQFLIFNQGSHKLLDPHLKHIGMRMKAGATLQDLTPDLQAMSKTLLHISKQPEQPRTAEAIPQQDTYLLQRIDELLADSAVPMRFQQQKATLRQRIKNNSDEQHFDKAIDSAIALLLDIKTYTSAEQNDIEGFLTDLSDKLGVIEQHAEQVGHANQISFDRRRNMDSEINQHLNHIKGYADEAVELSSLKTATSLHLDRLMLQILEHKQTELERQYEAQQQIAIMAEKLQVLELETASLRTKLKIEHDRALCDPLTGLPNRLAYKDRIEMETARWYRYRTPLSLAIWDIDHFKRINDNFGHKAGDKTLALVAQLLLNNCRGTDFIARYGGEEFIMLLPNTTADQTMNIAEKMRQIIQSCGFNHNGNHINLTLSCGISEFSGEDHHEDVFGRADQALYRAKQAGRNCCRIYQNENGLDV